MCGVSKATVSRVLNQRTQGFSVKPEVRQRILNTARQLGYSPNLAASSLKKKKSRIITILGFTAPLRDEPSIYPPLVNAAVKELQRHEYQAVATFPHYQTGHYTLPAWKTEAYLILQATGEVPVEKIVQTRVPYVILNGTAASPSGTGILVDEKEGMALLMDYLYRLGHRRIAYRDTRLSPHHYSVLQRRRFYEERCRDLGMVPVLPEPALKPVEFLQSSREQAITAVIAYSHREALALLEAAHQLQIDIPAQMSIACFNDLYPLHIIRPAITSVRLPLEDMGRTGARALMENIDRIAAGKTALDDRMLKPSLI
ncbi:MAG: LacI family transcriptional regulator, partial [Lentisphaerae bacterium]